MQKNIIFYKIETHVYLFLKCYLFKINKYCLYRSCDKDNTID